MSAENIARKPWWRRWFGSRSERAAVRFLKQLGYRILKRNFTCALGELDIVALEGEVIVFVEVRSTGSAGTDRPALSVNNAKQRQLTRLALHFLKTYRLLGRAGRFDVLALSWPAERREPEIAHHKNAFEPTDRFQMFS